MYITFTPQEHVGINASNAAFKASEENVTWKKNSDELENRTLDWSIQQPYEHADIINSITKTAQKHIVQHVVVEITRERLKRVWVNGTDIQNGLQGSDLRFSAVNILQDCQ